MRETPKGIRFTILFLLALFIVLTTVSGYLYRQNKSYQDENQRLIVVNDSILSVNIELKNQLQQRIPTAAETTQGNFKTTENK